jgi:hypothetical protein
VVVVRFVTPIVGDVAYVASPLKVDMLNGNAGMVGAVNRMVASCGSYAAPTRPMSLPPVGVPNTSKIALAALAGAVLR